MKFSKNIKPESKYRRRRENSTDRGPKKRITMTSVRKDKRRERRR